MNDEFKHNDELLQKWLKDVHQDVNIPDGTQSWLEVKAQLDKIRTRRRWIRRLQLGALVACASLLISFFITTDLPTAYSQFQGLVKKVQENFIDIFFEDPEPYIEQNPEAKTSSPPPDAIVSPPPRGEGRMEETSLDDARRKVMFTLVSPTYLPAGYALETVRIFQDSDGEYRTVFMEYVNGEGQILQFNQHLIRENSSPEKTTINHAMAIIKDTVINGYKAVLIIQDPDLTHLEWITADHIKQSIFGVLAEEEIISVAESLQ
ncbi:DUF4367 domain-containing protein [Paenibacillus lactis]|uniref:DUF4367 domain-containing protein n=1 Tax=Paenibacillus lactis TaxID=228574 RepID=A0ABS4FLX5_9BACL|nr:DUF4367 domain-containing protein [Paenibacillus lactis]MBP1897032.1 hypothetical protein [Paenibacillus lactis]